MRSWSVVLSIVLSVVTTEEAPSRLSVPPDNVTLPSVAPSSVSVCPNATVSGPAECGVLIELSAFTSEKVLSRSSVPPDRVTLSSPSH